MKNRRYSWCTRVVRFGGIKTRGHGSIPKGEYDDQEEALAAAKREFKEETGSGVEGDFIALSPVKLKTGKQVTAWAVEGDIDPATVVSNTITVEWPPRSGKQLEIPEVDRGAWFDIKTAKQKINSGQKALLDELTEKISQARI